MNMNRTATIMTALVALVALSACESRTASLVTIQTASIQWDEVTAADATAHAPKNANLIFMR
jgi:ABC-type proline/glycine betaine transport system substrate-binding protein